MFVSAIDPVAFSLGPVSIRWYGLLFSSGFIIGYFIMQYLFRKKHYNTEDLDKLLLYVFAGTVIGARLAHCLIYEPDFYLAHPFEILKIWHGGLASHGGMLGVLLALYLFLRRRRQYSFFEIADMLSVPTALVASMIRLGNFMNSEILGYPTDAVTGVVFARLGENFARHPVQLYESFAYFVIFIILFSVYFIFKNKPNGIILGLFAVLGFTARFFLEPFKEEQADYSTHSILSVGQYLSIPFIILGIALILYVCLKRRPHKEKP